MPTCGGALGRCAVSPALGQGVHEEASQCSCAGASTANARAQVHAPQWVLALQSGVHACMRARARQGGIARAGGHERTL